VEKKREMPDAKELTSNAKREKTARSFFICELPCSMFIGK
jgi:hypothetical protein